MGKRERKRQRQGTSVPNALRREDALVTELWAYDRALGVRNAVIARIGAELTDEEKEALAEFPRRPWDIDLAHVDLRAFYVAYRDMESA